MAESPMRSIRTLLTVFITLFLAGFTIVGTSGSASAEDVYRYWVYFQVKDGKFVSSDEGFGKAVPADGSIEAYRYAAPSAYPSPNLPRADLGVVTFDEVCGDTDAADGKKRVAVLIDYGVEADSDGADVPDPDAGCALVDEKATGAQTLATIADVRQKKSSFGPLLCGIDGYPATGCADVKAAAATPADDEPVDFALGSDKAESDDDDDSNMPMLLGIGAVVVLLGAGGVVLSRRNKS
jgi:LPXTG-motif cell wall-anchored protein